MAGRKRRATPDFLDEIIAQRTQSNPNFAREVDAAVRRRKFLRSIAQIREQLDLSQMEVATRMKTSQPEVAKIESGETDIRVTTLERYVHAVGGQLVFIPSRKRKAAPVTYA